MEQLVLIYTCASELNVISTCYIFLELLVQRINKHLNIPIPSLMLTTCICCLAGTIMFSLNPTPKPLISRGDVLFHFIPIYIVTTLYNMDILMYTKVMGSVCFLFMFSLLTTSAILVTAMRYVLHPHFEWSEAVLAALVVLPVQTTHALEYLQDMAKFNTITRILQVESIFTFTLVRLCFEYTCMIRNESVRTLSEHTFFILKFAFGAVGVGVLSGRLLAFCTNVAFNKPGIILSLILGTTTFVYFMCECVLNVSGDLAMIIVAMNLVRTRHKFTTEVDHHVTNSFQSMHLVAEVTILCLYLNGTLVPFWSFVSASSISSAMLLYVILHCTRVCSYLLVGLISNNSPVNLEYNERVTFILGLNGLKGSLNMILCCTLMLNDSTFKIGRMIVVEVFLLYLCSMFFNALPLQLVLSLTGMEHLSVYRRQNMNLCLKLMIHAKDVMTSMLKTFNYLADAQWSTIQNSIVLRHPYTGKPINPKQIDDTGINYSVLPMSTMMCPRCFNRVFYELSVRDVMSLCSVARTRLLRAKHVSINEQYACDAIDINTWQLISYYIDNIRFNREKHTKINIKSYLRPPVPVQSVLRNIDILIYRFQKVTMYFRQRFESLLQQRLSPPPKNNCGRLFFYLTNHVAYDITLLGCVIGVIALSSQEFLQPMRTEFIIAYTLLIIVFSMDFLMRLFGHHSMSSLKTSYVLIQTLCFLIVEIFLISRVATSSGNTLRLYSIATRIVAILRVFYILCASRYLLVTISNVLDEHIDDSVTFGFQLAASLAFCCEENLENLNKTFAIDTIRQIYTTDMRKEITYLHCLIRHHEVERPWITITMKTKQLVKTTLNHMQECLLELYLRGFIDSIEYNFIYRKIMERFKNLRKIKTVEPAKARDIFNQIPWLDGNLEIIKYLYDKAKRIYFDPGDIVIKDDQKPSGVYIVISGRLKLMYKYNAGRYRQMTKRGQIPNVDYLSSMDFEVDFQDDLMPGSTFGEKGFLTNRRYDCTIIADDRVQAFMIPYEVLQDGVLAFNNPVVGLEAMLWKYCYIHLAIAIMREAPIYKNMPIKDIKLKLDRAFVPSLRCYKMFKVIDQMEDVILIEGIAIDTVSRKMFYAPALIPRYIRKLYISKSPFVSITAGSDTKLMIIPAPGIFHLELMLHEEDVADIVSFTTTTCVLHSNYELSRRFPYRRRGESNERFHELSNSESLEFSHSFSFQSSRTISS